MRRRRKILSIARARHGGLLIAIGLLSLAACRELTSPTVPAAPPGRIGPVLVLDLEGRPDPRASVRLELLDPPSGDPVRINERTDSAGIVHADLPRGRYEIFVYPGTNTVDSWIVPDIEIPASGVTLDPRPHLHRGRVNLPAALSGEDLRISYRTRTPSGNGYDMRSPVDADGSYVVVWPLAGSYEVWVDLAYPHPSGSLRLALAYELPGPDAEFSPDLVQEEVSLTLRGRPLPGGWVRLDGHSDIGWMNNEAITGSATPLSYWAPREPGILTIDPGGQMPFIAMKVPHEFGGAPLPVIELGPWTATFELRTATGDPVYGYDLDLSEFSTGVSRSFNNQAERTTVYLRPGRFLVRSSCTGFATDSRIIDVDADTTVNVVLQRGP